MTGFLGEIAKRLAEKWVSLLALPGLLLLGVLAIAGVLGQRRWHDWNTVLTAATSWTRAVQSRGAVAIAGVIVLVLLASLALGLLARLLGVALIGAWTTARAAFLGRLRHQRWQRAQRRVREASDDTALAQLAARRNRIGLAPPRRATWIGDRVAATEARVLGQYGLDLSFAWTPLWLVWPVELRDQLTGERDHFDRAAVTCAWGLLYLAAGVRWWPATIAGVVVLVFGWRQARLALGQLCTTIEAAVDLHAAALGEAMQMLDGEFSIAVGRQITARLRKGA